jgi:hypothetical protein
VPSAGALGTRIVHAQPAPADRHEACLTFFPRHFHGGSILEIGAGDGGDRAQPRGRGRSVRGLHRHRVLRGSARRAEAVALTIRAYASRSSTSRLRPASTPGATTR